MSELVEAGRRIAAQLNVEALAMGDLAFAHSIWKEAGRQLPRLHGGAPPAPIDAPAGSGWNCRIMLFDPRGDLEADSMPDSGLEEEPNERLKTLADVGVWLAATANQYHASREEPLPVGLDGETLGRSILSLRVNLSRNGGRTWWRVPYTVGDDMWRAQVRVERAIGE